MLFDYLLHDGEAQTGSFDATGAFVALEGAEDFFGILFSQSLAIITDRKDV